MHDSSDHVAGHMQRREITLLFADLRGFTELAGSPDMDPLFCELLAHVMDCLTDAVVDRDGWVVDYYGDGLVAMWNAPTIQVEHPSLACGAALQMLEALTAVTADWIHVTQSELRLGIGIHTGLAQVGNAGSTRQAKYGPRGSNVHLTSRVEAATKELHVPLLATHSTSEQLSDSYPTNRVCRAQLPGVRQPVDLYAVRSSDGDTRLSLAWHIYDVALRQFEAGEIAAAADTLATIDTAANEVPSRFLIDRINRELGSNLRRRATDKPIAHPAGVVALSAK